jgi:uncharacterized Zn finger protein
MGRWDDGYGDFPPYKPVAQRRAEAQREVARRRKKGETITPVTIEGRKIATTFWGEAWCEHLEKFSDFESRLPRGRTYVRNGSVIHLKIEKGRITALVSGSEIYKITIEIAPLPKAAWAAIKKRCSGQIGSLVELLQGKLSKGVMEVVTDRDTGLFPNPKEIKLKCSCPDWASLCKHLAAVLYGVGHRLDTSPELLFLLRGVDHNELIEEALPADPTASKAAGQGAPTLAGDDLGAIFGIEIDPGTAAAPKKRAAAKRTPAQATRALAPVKPAPAPQPAPKVSRTTPKAAASKKAAATNKVAAPKKAAVAATKSRAAKASPKPKAARTSGKTKPV